MHASVIKFFSFPVMPRESIPSQVALERKPAEFLQFYQCSLALSIALVFARMPVLEMAFRWWGRCESGRPLPLWILVDCLIALLQAPLRAGILKFLPSTSEKIPDISKAALPVLQSRAVHFSTILSTAHFVWTLVGALWAIEARSGVKCPLRFVARFLLATTLLRAVLVLAYYFMFVCRLPAKVVLRYSRENAEEQFGYTSCAVCLCDFEENQELQQFGCKHVFCKDCAASWLKVRRVCPMCLRAV
jgi:hypothetical protein